jgi:hypothetical protein
MPAVQAKDQRMHWGSILAGFVSGALWLYASWINVPTNLATAFGDTIHGLDEMRSGFAKQARYNSCAAVATALATMLQATALIVQ